MASVANTSEDAWHSGGELVSTSEPHSNHRSSFHGDKQHDADRQEFENEYPSVRTGEQRVAVEPHCFCDTRDDHHENRWAETREYALTA